MYSNLKTVTTDGKRKQLCYQSSLNS